MNASPVPGGAPTAGVPICPDRELLLAIRRGTATVADVEPWEEHIENCPLCEQVIQGAPDDIDPLFAEFQGNGVRTKTHDPASDTPHDQSPTFRAPARQYGPYEIEAELGRGGMGIVYRARQRKPDRFVALKVMTGSAALGSEAIERFRKEYEAIARLQNPHITTLYQSGWEDKSPWFAMEYVGGGTLAERLRAGPLSAPEAAELLIPIASAIHFAHSKGVIHRDLKPSNILLSQSDEPAAQARDETQDPLLARRAQENRDPLLARRAQEQCVAAIPKVSDFGLAKLMDDSVALTMTGKVMGTPAYMAPEQARGRNDEIGPRTDVYGLGAILYECLTQRPPFVGPDSAELIRQAINDEPVAPRKLVPKLPRDLETICLKCLQKDPSRRYESAQALADDLQRFREDRPIVARPVGRIERAARWCKRNPTSAVNIFVVASLIIGLIVGLFVYQESVNERDRQEAARRLQDEQTRSEMDRNELERLNAVRFATVSHFGNLLTENDERSIGRKPGWTKRNQEALHEAIALDVDRSGHVARLRTQLAATLAARDLSEPREIFVPHSKDGKSTIGPGPIAFHPDGKLLAVANHITPLLAAGVVHLLESENWGIVRTLKFPGLSKGGNFLAFSPDGQVLALATRDGQIHLWDLGETEPKPRSWTAHRGEPQNMAFARDGRTLISQGQDKKLIRWDLSPEKPVAAATFNCEPLQGTEVGFSPPNAPDECIALQSPGGTIRFLNAKFEVDGEPIYNAGRLPALSPDGRSVAVVEGLNLYVLDRQTRRLAYSLAIQDDAHHDVHVDEKLVFSPDASLLATANEHSGLIKLWEIASGKLIGIGRVKGGRANLAFSPDGSMLVAGGESHIYVFRISVLVEQIPQGITPYPIRCFGMHSDGRRFAAHTLYHSREFPGDLAWWNGAEWPSKLWADGRVECVRAIDGGLVHSLRLVSLKPTREFCAYYRSGSKLHCQDSNPANSGKSVAAQKVEVVRCIRRDELVLGDGIEVKWMNWRDGKERVIFNNGAVDAATGRGGIHQISVHGDSVLIADGAGNVHHVGLDGRQRAPSRRLNDYAINAATISPDGTRAVVGDVSGGMYLLQLPDLKLIAKLPQHDGSVEEVVFLRGDLIATASLDQKVRFMNLNGEILFSIPFDRPVVQMELAFDGDSPKLAVLLRNERAIRIWHLDRLEKRFSEFGIGLPLTP